MLTIEQDMDDSREGKIRNEGGIVPVDQDSNDAYGMNGGLAENEDPDELDQRRSQPKANINDTQSEIAGRDGKQQYMDIEDERLQIDNQSAL